MECEEAWDEDEEDEVEMDSVEAGGDCDSEEGASIEALDSELAIEAIVDSELTDDWRSECAMVYFVFMISSSNGVRNETLFSAGKNGRAGAILRGIMLRAGLLLRMDARLWGCL